MTYKSPMPFLAKSLALAGLSFTCATHLIAANSALVGWSEYGLWETDDSDVSVFSLMPPFSTIHAQLMITNTLVTSSNNVTVTYEAVADANGSINRTSVGKGNFYNYASNLWGVALAPEQGLAGFGMPGPANTPQPMTFDPSQNEFTATGIPVTPFDDQGKRNNYPLFKLVARDGSGSVIASTQIAVPVTDQMDCRSCHGSGSQTEARPPEGWFWDPNPVRDYKLNILRSHDDHQLGSTAFTTALAKAGYNPKGLVATVLQDGRPIACLRCHLSNGLPGSGMPERKTFTQVMHTKHAFSIDPTTGKALSTLNNSTACLHCHAGPDTLRLRGVHHGLANADGSATMQCTSCHGSMTTLGAAGRQGWLDEPNCQSCHTGTATVNNGQIRYTNVVDAVTGQTRVPLDTTFATEANMPSSGWSLFRASHGHGGLHCEACHGSTHAELVSLQSNDNAQSVLLQGHSGRIADCTACHTTSNTSIWHTSNGGPHGLHPVDSSWANNHQTGRAACTACHGSNYRGTVLSAMLGSRNYSGINLWQENEVSCYNCHNGPGGNDAGPGLSAPTAYGATVSTTEETPVDVSLLVVGTSLTYRIVSPPANGMVALNGNVATYVPAAGYVGSDSFHFAANNGSVDSSLGTITINVNPGSCSLTASSLVPFAAVPNSPVPFRGSVTESQCTGSVTYDWNFGDGTSHMTGANVSHVFALSGNYNWTMTVSANGTNKVVAGAITISPTLGPVLDLTLTPLDPWTLQVAWPVDGIPTSLESSADLMSPYPWTPSIYPPDLDPTGKFWTVPVDLVDGNLFWRVRRVP